MVWQDIAISMAEIVFSISLFPQIYLGFRTRRGDISLMTSIPTTLGLFLIAYAFFTLSLYYSAIVSIVTGILWMILLFLRLIF
tara:strand:+ start:188 stop:436 length:249 start_codon:yes stop_codon:yes gene_type:complete